MQKSESNELSQIRGGWSIYVFSLALVYQFFHSIEHFIQMYQHYFLNLAILHSHGAIFFLDLEWNHFLFNTIYLSCILYVIFYEKWYTKERFNLNPVVGSFLLIGAVVESWHVTEHTVRIYQHVQSGCEPCMGILGPYLDVIYLHGTYNFLSLTLPLGAFIGGKYYKRLWQLI